MVTPNDLFMIPKKHYLVYYMSRTKCRDKKALKTCLASQVAGVIQLIQVILKMRTYVRPSEQVSEKHT